ncbi:MAG: hypothetical protein DRG83_01740 [Deltaproteobacteria bacterium]|nr:MAG: hypothetical protein DRG83_01740 [Deltaproteobacteria bacterium]
MVEHEAIQKVINRIKSDLIGGAADTAKEIVDALVKAVEDSKASEATALVQEIEVAIDAILAVMPSFAPPINALHLIMRAVEDTLDKGLSVHEIKSVVLDAASSFHVKASDALTKVAHIGAEMIQNNDVIFTYSMSSTVWKIIATAKRQGKNISVIVTESRPKNEGLWTVSEMAKYGIPITVGIDAAIGTLIPGSNMVIVGADAIASNGSALCKVGTYPTALVAREHGVPFYIAADTWKFDTSSLLGFPFKIEHVTRSDILDDDAPTNATVRSPLFDITPAYLISAVITERGVIPPTACFAIMQTMPLSRTISAKIERWARGRIKFG